jgi:hypothetical protein
VIDHGGGLRLVRHIAGDPDRLMTGRSKLIGRSAERVPVDVGKYDRGARFSESLDGRKPDAGAGSGDKGDLAPES